MDSGSTSRAAKGVAGKVVESVAGGVTAVGIAAVRADARVVVARGTGRAGSRVASASSKVSSASSKVSSASSKVSSASSSHRVREGSKLKRMILEKILNSKKKEIEGAKRKIPLERIRDSLKQPSAKRSLQQALRRPEGELALIAEIKKASPSRGLIREAFRPLEIAQIYRQEGACALSVLTDEPFFSGSLDILKEVRGATPLPVLRKDFILDPYQIYESALAGADALLLIVRLLDETTLRSFLKITRDCGMEALVEVHTEPQLKQAVDAGAGIVGVNNRDLATMEVDLNTAAHLIPKLPRDATAVAESGIRKHEDILRLKALGAHAVLIGEAFMEAEDLGARVREIMHGAR